jgi:hypothetical protein
MSFRVCARLALFFIFAPIGVGHAYTLTTTTSGQNIHWPYGQKLFLAGNPTGRENFPADFFKTAVINGLQQWNWATGGMFDFDYWQGTDPSIYEANLDQNGLSSIFFASNSTAAVDPNVIGFTQVWYNNDTGNMVEADVMLNDRNYELTTNPQDTSSNGIGPSGYPQVYIANIITHELGHAIGLSHAGNLNSTMLYVEFSGQDQLACDDWSAARHLYPSNGSNTGTLTGTIVSPTGDAVAGALVIAISKSRGTPLASVHTDQNGEFNFGALEAGQVALMVEPFQGSPASVPARVQAKITSEVCDGNSYPPNFYTNGDGHTLEQYSVASGSNLNVGTLRLSCNAITDSQTRYQAGAPDMLVDINQFSVNKNYQFTANGPFKITGIGYLLLSSVKVSLSVTDANGNAIAVQTLSPLYTADSNFSIVDTQVVGTATGVINVQVTTSSIPLSNYPTPALWPSSTPYFMITFDSAPTAPAANALPNNARCAPPTTFAAYQSPAGNPVLNSAADTTRSSAGFCGNANAATLHAKKSAHRSVPFEAIFSWFFPLLIALFTQLYFRSRAAKLKASCVNP